MTSKSRRWRKSREIIIVAAVAALAIAWNTSFRAPPRFDGAGYSVLALSLATGRGYRAIDHPDAPAHAHFPPAYPLALAALWKVFGRSELVAHVFSCACFIVATVATLAWFRTFLPRRAAFILSLAFVVNWAWLRLGGDIRSESFYMMLCQLSMLAAGELARRGDWRSGALVGVLLGAATLTRHVGICLAAAVGLDLIWRRKKKGLAALSVGGSFVLILAPWLVWLRSTPADNQLGLFPKGKIVSIIINNILFYMERIPDQLFGPLIEVGTVFRPRFASVAITISALVSAIVFLGWIRLLFRPRVRLAALLPLLTLPLLFVWPFTEAGRFLAPLSPSILTGAFEGLRFLLQMFMQMRKRLISRRLVFVLLLAGLPYSLYSSLSDRLAVERRASIDFDAACVWLSLQADVPGPVLARHPGEVFWLSGASRFPSPKRPTSKRSNGRFPDIASRSCLSIPTVTPVRPKDLSRGMSSRGK